MALFKPMSPFTKLQDRIVIVAGGATGIGAATIKALSHNKARVVFGDVNTSAAHQLCESMPSLTFVVCDVSKHEDVYRLFKAAHDEHGQIDHAITCAGIFEQGNWFDPKLTIESIEHDHGNTKVLDVNVLGTLNFARVATVFLRDGSRTAADKSLTLLSSVNSFRESPGLYLYQTSKHAIQGILRSSRKMLYERDHIRVNAVCPGMTDTAMSAKAIPTFKQPGLFWQSPEVVAEVILGIVSSENMNGKAIYVEGGDAWEFEDSFKSAQLQWLGEEPTRRMRANAEAVNKGALIPK